MGALGGKFADYGVDDNFIKQTREKVTEGTSALFLLTSGAVQDRIVEAMEGQAFDVVSTNLAQGQGGRAPGGVRRRVIDSSTVPILMKANHSNSLIGFHAPFYRMWKRSSRRMSSGSALREHYLWQQHKHWRLPLWIPTPVRPSGPVWSWPR